MIHVIQDWSKQSSLASSITEPSSPLISERSGSQEETPNSGQLNKYFPTLDSELQEAAAYVYDEEPLMNPDNLDDLSEDANELAACETRSSGNKSACLTPVSFNLDLSIMANKGSITLSVEVCFLAIQVFPIMR